MAPAHALQMGGFELAVDETAMRLYSLGKGNECEFRGVWYKAEHALTDETPADTHTVESADKAGIGIAHLKGCGITQDVQPFVGLLHLITEPCPRLLVATVGQTALLNDAVEVTADAHRIAIAADELAHGMADMDLGGEDDKTVHGTPPHDFGRLAEIVPWEDAETVGRQKPIGRQVATYGQ